jgi:AcrR family transcriptional regulator
MKEKSDKRKAILDATLKLISIHGFHRTSMAMVVKESCVSTGVIYHYFVSKEEIIMELYKAIKLAALEAMVKNFTDDLSIYERYKNIWFESLNYCRLHPVEISFLEQFEYSPYFALCSSEEFLCVMKPISDLISESLEKDVVKNLPVDLLTSLFNEGAVLLGKKYSVKTDLPDEKLTELTFKACWDAIKK